MNLVQLRAYCKEAIAENPAKTEGIQTIFAQATDAVEKGNQEEEVVGEALEAIKEEIAKKEVEEVVEDIPTTNNGPEDEVPTPTIPVDDEAGNKEKEDNGQSDSSSSN